jgi:hypothetical protein
MTARALKRINFNHHQGVRTMTMRRHSIHYLFVTAVLAGSIGFTLASAGPASAASPNDFLCYVSGSPQLAAVGASYTNPLEVELSSTACTSPTLDTQAGNTVTFSVVTTAGGPSATFSPSATVTASGGQASVMLSANGVVGTFEVVASSPATASNPAPQNVTYLLTNAGSGPASITAGIGSVQATPVGTAFTLGLAVTVDDAFGNPLSNLAVTFLAPSSGASGTFSTTALHAITVETDGAGVAVAPTFVANQVPGGYVVTASVAGYAPSAAFALVNQASTSFTVTSASPFSLAQGSTKQNVTIIGTGFLSGATATFSNSNVVINSTTFVSPTSLTLNVTTKSSATIGPASVTVVNPGGAMATGTDVVTVESALSAATPAAFSLGFAKHSDVLTVSTENRLKSLAHVLVSRPTIKFVSYADNASLAKNRANSVARFLKSLVGTFHVSFVDVTSSTANTVRVITVRN